MEGNGVSTRLALAIFFGLLVIGSWTYMWYTTPEEEQVDWKIIAKETYQSPDKAFSFEYPANWKLLENTQTKVEFGIENQEKNILVGIEVKWKSQFPEAGTPENYAATRVDAVRDLFKVYDGDIVYDKKTQHYGLTAYEIVWWTQSGEIKVRSKDLHVVKENSVYSISVHALQSDYWKWLDAFDRIIASFKLT